MLKSGNRPLLVLHALALVLLLSEGPLTTAQRLRQPPVSMMSYLRSRSHRMAARRRGSWCNEPSQRFGRIELWDTVTEKLRHVIKGFDGPVRSVSFLPDGQTLVSGSTEFRASKIQTKARSRDGESFGEVKWWDTPTGELNRKVTLPSEGNVSLRVTCSPDGKQLAMVASFLQFSFFSSNAPQRDYRRIGACPAIPVSWAAPDH